MASRPRILLAGCPNVGKSVLFHSLTGMYAAVSNYPGTTVELSRGVATFGPDTVDVIDTPGIYGFPPLSAEERVVADTLLSPGPPRVIVQVASALELSRMLAFTQWLKLFGLPMILAVNMLDEARSRGVSIDTHSLERDLGLPVIGCVATTGEGLSRLKSEISRQLDTARTDHTISPASAGLIQQALAHDPHARAAAVQFSARAAEIAARATQFTGQAPAADPDRWLLHPTIGPIIALLTFYLVCVVFVGRFCAGTIVDLLDRQYLQHIQPAIQSAASLIPYTSVRALITGEFGLASLGLRYAAVIILPVVTGFFLSFSLLEDLGYLPRLSVLADRLFRFIGLSGTAAIPLTLGLGCGTMATVFTRILPTERERTIATVLLALSVPCSAQLGVIAALLSPYPVALVTWGVTVAISGLLAAVIWARALPGRTPTLVLELPPLRLPRVKNVAAKVVSRVRWYAGEVVPMFCAVSVGLWALDELGAVAVMKRGIATVAAWAYLPSEVAPALLLGFFRRDYGAAGLYAIRHRLSVAQLAVASVLLTLSYPCVAQVVVMVRERGYARGLGIVLFVAAVALAVTVCLGRVLGAGRLGL